MKSEFQKGLRDGVPIALGYLSVSFSVGIMAVSGGLSVFQGALMSLTNVTSAGQFAGIQIITAGGTVLELILTQFVINLRYALMSLSLSQKLNGRYNLLHRIISAFGITDEIFAVASGKSGEIDKRYMYGLITLPYIFWAAGTAAGAFLGEILPEGVKSALGIAIYGMFIAIVIPPSKKSRGVLFTAVLAAVLSCVIYYVPLFDGISSGISVIICTVIAAALAALLFPRKTAEAGQ